MSYLVTIDPGKATGLAVFWQKELRHAYVGTPGDMLSAIDLEMISKAVIEMPKWYPHAHKEMDDLLRLAVIVGEFKREFERCGIKTELVWPRTWKGTVRKDIHNKRVIEKLSPYELSLLPVRPKAKDWNHNMVDAVGIGLWKLGRM